MSEAGYQALLSEKAQRLTRAAHALDWHELVATRTPHEMQRQFIFSPAKRKVVRAGRRGGKTTGIAILAVKAFLKGKRVLYAAPTEEQVDRFWKEVKAALRKAIEAGVLYKNETLHIIEVPNTENRIRAKTAWDAETLRGDYADLLILDEFQLMNEDVWAVVGAPMLLDNDGDAAFIYTPPSLHSKYRTKARDPRNASKLFQKAKNDTTGRWEAFHFTSHDNPHLAQAALDEIALDMTAAAIKQEIEAEDMVDVPGALWTQTLIDTYRVDKAPELKRVVIGVDPPGGATECGIVGGGLGVDDHLYILADCSLLGTPDAWSREVVAAYELYAADRVLGESNYGGDMVKHTIRSAEGGKEISYRAVQATRGKMLRAEPVAAQYERGKVHHVGTFPHLEAEMCGWVPGAKSPNRLDAMVWVATELIVRSTRSISVVGTDKW